ncbi:MAG TPA: tetratricopeptide repeat protein [Terriglobales bacterium]|nr:tetratricopeptide repeat protein [Terriglobales bacterium]
MVTLAGSSSGAAAVAARAPIPSVDFGPRYRVECILGVGGMGTVYKAYDKDLDRLVALKLVRPELVSDPASSQRFKQELLLASKISHKNVLRIHDLGEAGTTRFISMAYIEGQDLQRLISSQGRLPVERAAHFARQLCAALEAAHGEGVVHRDLKPQNILVDQADNIYVSDFGLAKSLESDVGMTRTGQFLGTPRYMSPEQAEGKQVDHRSDLYALGLILCEMLTGGIPFAPIDSALQVMLQRIQEKPRDPKELSPELPDYLARIIRRCLEKNVELRYQSAREVLADLEAQRATPSRSVQIALPAVSKRAWMAAVAGLLVVGIILALPPVRKRIFPGASQTSSTRSNVPTLNEGKYVAVLPLRVLGDASQLKYAADGLVEALSTKLFKLKDLHVTSSSDIERVRNQESPQKAARALGVNLVVYGTAQGAADRLRIILNLDDVATGQRLWSEEFSGVTQDLLTLEDHMYARLLTALQLNPSSEDLARGTAHPTENVEAYDLYLRGRNALRGMQDVRNIQTAINFYNDAIKKDPQFALAYAGLADASMHMYREKKDSFWSEKALGAAQQAQRMNDQLPEVHLALGSVYTDTGKSSEAVAELNRALALAPKSDEVYRRLGAAYLGAGNKQEAIRNYQKAIIINPYFWVNHNALGAAYLRLGENENALTAFRRVTELEPENVFGHMNTGLAYYRQGRWDESIAAFQKALAIQPSFQVYSNMGVAYFYSKRYEDSVRMFEKAVELNSNEQVAVGNLADAYRWSGRADQAKATYDKAISLAYKDLQVNPRNTTALEYLALYYAKKGDPAQALNFIRRARAINRNDVELMYNEAVVNALAGRYSEALKALSQALEKGYPPKEVGNDPELKNLHGQPQFQHLLGRFGKSG